MSEAERERAKVVAYLRKMARTRPPDHVRKRNPHWTEDAIVLAFSMLLASADQIEAGIHLKL